MTVSKDWSELPYSRLSCCFFFFFFFSTAICAPEFRFSLKQKSAVRISVSFTLKPFGITENLIVQLQRKNLKFHALLFQLVCNPHQFKIWAALQLCRVIQRHKQKPNTKCCNEDPLPFCKLAIASLRGQKYAVNLNAVSDWRANASNLTINFINHFVFDQSV